MAVGIVLSDENHVEDVLGASAYYSVRPLPVDLKLRTFRSDTSDEDVVTDVEAGGVSTGGMGIQQASALADLDHILVHRGDVTASGLEDGEKVLEGHCDGVSVADVGSTEEHDRDRGLGLEALIYL
jgi:hypothetical protein